MSGAETPDLATGDLDEMLESTADLHRDLDGARVLITGGTGFFGRWLLRSWADATDRLGLDRTAVVVTRDPESAIAALPWLARRDDVELVRGDVLGPRPVEGTFDAAIHAATAASLALTVAAPRVMFDTVVTGTANVLEWLAPSGPIPLLLTSSGAVYGAQPPDLPGVPETYLGGPDSLAPGAVYAEAKRAAEMLCAVAGQHDPQARIARCFAFVGPHLPIDAHFAIGNFIRDGLAGGPIVIEGDGTPVRSYLYAGDLVAWLWTVLLRGTPMRPYNVGSGDAIDLSALARVVGEQCACEVVVRREPVPGAPAPRYVPDVSRAAGELGLMPRVSVDAGIRRTIDWHRRA